MEKLCNVCAASKPIEQFHRRSDAKDGRQSRCKPCAISLALEHQRMNPEKKQERNRRYRAKNPEAHKQSDAQWRAKDPDRAAAMDAEKSRKWRAANKSKVRELTSERRRICTLASPAWRQPKKIAAVYEMAAAYKFEVDHIVPLRSPIVCGLHVWWNLQVLDSSLNKMKSNKMWPDAPHAED